MTLITLSRRLLDEARELLRHETGYEPRASEIRPIGNGSNEEPFASGFRLTVFGGVRGEREYTILIVETTGR